MSNTPVLSGRVAIVTGAGHPKGIGAAIARELSRQGAAVALTDLDANRKSLDALAAELNREDAPVLAESVDLTEAKQITACVDAVLQKLGRLDILVNNAGVGIGSSRFLEQTETDFNVTFAVNVLGAMRFAQAVIPAMQARGGGAIVNIASLSGLRNIPPTPPVYTASKFALVGMTKAIAQEFGPDNIRCNAVCPGSVDTQMRETVMGLIAKSQGISPEAAEAEENATISLGRPASPEEIATVAVFLAGPGAAYLTGAAIPVDGGMSFGL